MAIMTKHEHGMFSWTDLSTTDTGAAKKFYGALFGWTHEDMPMPPGQGTYTMSKLNGKDAAAITDLNQEQKAMGVPPHWNAYFTVNDVDAVTKKVEGAGGKMIMPAFDVMDVGRMSVIADPTGAVFCLWTPKKHIGAQIANEPNAITWCELMTSNVDACAKFYAAVFGWKAEKWPQGEYTVLKAGDKSAAGMMPLPADMKNVPPNWLVYFAVASTDATAKKAQELGGKLIAPPEDIPNVGRFAVIADGQGAVFGILQSAQR